MKIPWGAKDLTKMSFKIHEKSWTSYSMSDHGKYNDQWMMTYQLSRFSDGRQFFVLSVKYCLFAPDMENFCPWVPNAKNNCLYAYGILEALAQDGD